MTSLPAIRSFRALGDTHADFVGPKIGVVGFARAAAWRSTLPVSTPNASRLQGEIYVAGADNDQSYPPDMAARLQHALTAT